MYPLLESIKIKNGFAFHLPLHQERMNKACNEFLNESCKIDILSDIYKNELPQKGLYKCRLLYDHKNYTIELAEYKAREISSLKLISDDEISYEHKFSDRENLNDLLSQKGQADDILIVKNSLITDTSYSNVILWNGLEWHTPNKPLLNGIQREYLIRNEIIKEIEISGLNLRNYSKLALINAMMDFEDKIVLDIDSILE